MENTHILIIIKYLRKNIFSHWSGGCIKQTNFGLDVGKDSIIFPKHPVLTWMKACGVWKTVVKQKNFLNVV